MPRYRFSKEDSRKGGWERARQRAAERRQNPTEAERCIHAALRGMGCSFETEVEVWTGTYPQFLDVVVSAGENFPTFVIEVDGSKGWHNETIGSKMRDYDITKRKYLLAQQTPLLVLSHYVSGNTADTAIRRFRRMLPKLNGQIQWRYEKGKLSPLDQNFVEENHGEEN